MILIWIEAIGLAISELEVVFIESTVGTKAVLFGAASTINTFYTFLLRIIIGPLLLL